MALLTISSLSAACAFSASDRYDVEGPRLVPLIEAENPIPIDGMSGNPGIYCEAWSQLAGFQWVNGSRIIVYGIKDAAAQDKILAQIDHLRATPVKVDFYDDSRFVEHQRPDGLGHGAYRLETPLLREVVLK